MNFSPRLQKLLIVAGVFVLILSALFINSALKTRTQDERDEAYLIEKSELYTDSGELFDEAAYVTGQPATIEEIEAMNEELEDLEDDRYPRFTIQRMKETFDDFHEWLDDLYKTNEQQEAAEVAKDFVQQFYSVTFAVGPFDVQGTQYLMDLNIESTNTTIGNEIYYKALDDFYSAYVKNLEAVGGDQSKLPEVSEVFINDVTTDKMYEYDNYVFEMSLEFVDSAIPATNILVTVAEDANGNWNVINWNHQIEEGSSWESTIH